MIINTKIIKNKLIESDYSETKEIYFIKNVDALNLWSSEFFIAITEDLK